MLYFLLSQAFSLLLDLIWLSHRVGHDKDLEILLLRQQLRILQRKQPRAPRMFRLEKLVLVALAGKLGCDDERHSCSPRPGRPLVQA